MIEPLEVDTDGHAPSPVFFHLPAIQYMPCLSITTEFDGPALTWAPIVSSFGPANCGTIFGTKASCWFPKPSLQ